MNILLFVKKEITSLSLIISFAFRMITMMYHVKTKWTHTTHWTDDDRSYGETCLKKCYCEFEIYFVTHCFFYNYFLLVLVSSISPTFLSCNYMYYILLYHCFLFFLGLRYWSSNAPEKGIWQHGCSIYCRKTARSSGMEIQFQ